MTHTQGEWKAYGRDVFAGDKFIGHAEFGDPKAGYVEYDEAIANANLIAAAPKLLEVIEAIIERDLLSKKPSILSLAQKIIAQAKGGN